MIRTTFEWREDEELGGYGWIPKGKPNFNACDGRGIAHDSMEHFANEEETMDAEMRAFGAILRGRGEGGWFFQGHVPNIAYHLGSDIAGFLRDMRYGEWKLTDPGKTYALKGDMEDEIQAGIKNALKTANDEADSEDNPFVRDQTTDWMIGWMRRGYRMAHRRWHGADACELSWLYDSIAKEHDEQFKGGEEGDQLIVTIDPRNLRFTMQRHEVFYSEY